MYHINADIFKVMGLLNVSIKSPQNRIFIKCDIIVKDNVVAITLEEKSECKKHVESKFMFEDVNVIDQSLQFSQINTDQLNFHLQMDVDHKNSSGFKKPSSEQYDTSNQHETRNLILSQKFICSCAACSHNLFSSDQFDEVLPAGNFSEIAESSWCLCRCGGGAKRHRMEDFSSKYDKHSNHVGSCNDHDHSTPIMNPSKNIIFVSETSLMFEVNAENIKSNDSGSLICSKCKNTLGVSSSKLMNGYKRRIDSDLKQLHLHSLSFTFPQSSFQMWPSSLDDLQMKVSEMLTSENNVGSRFVVEVRTEENKLRPLVLMTLLSMDDIIYKHDCEALEGEHLLKPVTAIKVLVKDCVTDDDVKLGKDWLNDFSVENIEIPERLATLFVDSIKNNDLLSGEKAMNGFGVSYLRKRKF